MFHFALDNVHDNSHPCPVVGPQGCAVGSQDSGRYRLIEALKPNLSKERQKKADEAMQILKILEILPLISELYKGGENNADK